MLGFFNYGGWNSAVKLNQGLQKCKFKAGICSGGFKICPTVSVVIPLVCASDKTLSHCWFRLDATKRKGFGGGVRGAWKDP